MATNPEEQMSDLFYEIDDLIDFLNEEEEEENALVMVKKPCHETGAFLLPLLTPPPPAASPGGGGGTGDDSLECSSNQKQLDEKLDYLTPAFLDECDSFLADVELPSVAKIDAFFRDSSPISVLEPAANCSGDSSSSSSSHSSTSASASHSCGRPFPARARSKRHRRQPAAFYLPSPPSHPVNESFGESESSPVSKKKLKIIIKSSAATAAAATEEESGSPGLRKCAHCGIQKTPQWRAGPTGPKTLCNACGVRYKTGRLFPEYRPAASPTFVPALHSNSHKKVVEMRMKVSSTAAGAGHDDGCDLLQHIRRPH
ncbi:GATA transcription factor 11-like [Curcuma longa]|uniref:GATA transcription factor 11-like n=1 Tax=Curcuma longa TaxID=136217 RepID=UPI003D9E039B